MASHNTITIKGDGIRKEALASGTPYPGHLLERASATEFKVHATSGGNCYPFFAVEDDLQGNGIADAYVAARQIVACIFRPGDEVLAVLAEDENVAVGDYLMSNGNGELKKLTAQDLAASAGSVYPRRAVAVALEAMDLSASAAVALASRRLHVEII